MSKFRLRSRFLVVRLLIAAGLTAAVILIVRYSFAKQAVRQISAELAGCRERFQAVQAQNDEMLARALAIVAESAEIRKMTSGEPRVSGGRPWPQIAREAGTDLLVLADERGTFRHGEPPDTIDKSGDAGALLNAWGNSGEISAYWHRGKKLYRVQRREVTGGGRGGKGPWVLVAGIEMGPRMAAQVGAICGCEVAFADTGEIIASTMDEVRERQLAATIGARRDGAAGAATIALSNQAYRMLSMKVAATSPSLELVALRSLAAASAQQSEFMRLMIVLAVVAMVVGFFLVLRVSDTFARPLGNLVQAVRALEKGDFRYPVKVDSRDELAEVTQAFDQMRSSVLETQEQLIRSERLATIGQMASSISHDLRHPLTAIVANSEFLCEEKLTVEQRQGFYLEIRAAVDQMNDLVESLLEFSRGRESPRIVPVNLDDVIERVVHSVGKRAEFHGVQLHVDCPPSFECAVDPLKVERAVGNLVINACEAVATAGTGRVEVRVSGTDGKAEIRIVDDGPGVAETIRKTIFQPFVSHGKPNGTGLGLAVVQKICRDHGGEATLESSRQGHTVFKLTLPRGK